MIDLKLYREYFEKMNLLTHGIGSVKLVNVAENMADTLKGIRRDDLPVLFVVVPSARDSDDCEPDRIEEVNDCLVFLMDRTDPQRRTALQVLERLQPLTEHLKAQLRADAATPCHWLNGLRDMATVPETGFYTDYAGWSVSFRIDSE